MSKTPACRQSPSRAADHDAHCDDEATDTGTFVVKEVIELQADVFGLKGALRRLGTAFERPKTVRGGRRGLIPT